VHVGATMAIGNTTQEDSNAEQQQNPGSERRSRDRGDGRSSG
jgi:hypothetical protein